MKKFLVAFLSVLFGVFETSYAQSTLLASLNHNGEITVFYGATALREAHAAATHGDVISLSSGSFLSVDIEKAVTIRGAGMELDSVRNIEPTIITKDFKITIPDGVQQRLVLEGIYSDFTIRNEGVLISPQFMKCRFNYLNDGAQSNKCMKDAQFIHCRIAGNFSSHGYFTATFVNCVISAATIWYSNIHNCIIGRTDALTNCYVTNSIFFNKSKDRPSFYLDKSVSAYNCVSVPHDAFSSYKNNYTNTYTTTYEEIFKTFNNEDLKFDSENFELTDEAKTKFLGIDGTQVGIYGGNLPFSSIPTNPQIIKCNVAGKSTADGKLSIDVEVKSAE